MTTTARFATLAAGLALSLFAACGGGGGGGGGGGPTEPPPPQVPFAFTASGASGVNTVTLGLGAATNATTMVLEVRANQIAGVYGAAFELSYPSAALAVAQATEGSLLSAGGATTSFQVSETSPGRLVVGISRLGAVGGVDANGVLLTLSFTARASGNGAFAFRNNQVVGSDGLPLIAVAWGAGSVQVNR